MQGLAPEVSQPFNQFCPGLRRYALPAAVHRITNDGMTDVLHPSPPAVMVNMLAATLDVIVTPIAAVRDDLVIIETVFKDGRGTVAGHLWVLPDPSVLDLAA